MINQLKHFIMRITIEQCHGITKALISIKNANNVSFNFAWQLDDIIRELKIHVERSSEEQLKLLKEYGEEMKMKPGAYTIPEINREIYIEKLTPIMQHEVDVNINKFTLKQFRMEKITVPAQVETSFLRMVTEEEQK